MVGLDVTHQALFTPDDTEAIRGRGIAGRLTAELVDFYARSHPHRAGTPIHDAVAVAQVIDPSLLTLEHCHVEIDCGPVSRGRTLVDRHHVTGREPNVHVATGIDPGFAGWLAERIAALG
jgi:inosine-uridine nucleoside N-ribohydrolase